MKEGARLAGPAGLSFRPRTQASFLLDMTLGARQSAPLARLNTAVASDFTNALMSSWARACDVLSFYQQRIANEGYISTAIEPLSVVCLAAEIGQQRRPALGAEADVALRLIAAPSTGDGITIRPGPSLTVQNAPASPETLPAVFECAETAELRAEWNAIAPVVAPVPVPATLWPGCRSIRLSGTATGLRPGGALLLTAGGGSWLAVADTVQAARSAGCTLVTWRTGIPEPALNWNPDVEDITVFQQTAGLFGRAAQEWSELSDKQKEAIGVRPGGLMLLDQNSPTAGLDTWQPPLWRSLGPPPPQAARALLAIGQGRVLAATGRGIFRWTKSAGWQALTLPPGRNDVRSLHAGCDGKVYAGTADGFVLSSTDGGDRWVQLTEDVLYPPKTKTALWRRLVHWKRKDAVAPVVSQLAVPIHAIATWCPPADATPLIYIGTDQGVFMIEEGDDHWQPYNDGLPGFDAHSGRAEVAVNAFLLRFHDEITAATAGGTFMRVPSAQEWVSVPSVGPPEKLASTSVAASEASTVYIGTSAGIFYEFHGYVILLSSQGWTPNVSSLAVAAECLYASTDEGVFTTTTQNYAGAWYPCVQEIDLFSIDPLFADGLDAGGVSTALFERFARFGIVLEAEIAVLPVYDGVKRHQGIGWQLAEALPSKRVFRIYRGDRLVVTQWVANAVGAAPLLTASDDGVFASLPFGPVLNQQWPDFALDVAPAEAGLPAGVEIFLDRRVTGVEPGSAIVLAPMGKSIIAGPEVYQVLAVDAVVHKAFGRQGIVTRIIVESTAQIVEPTARLLSTDLRTTDVYLVSRAVAPFTATAPSGPVAGAALTLSGVHTALEPGRKLQLSGPRAAAAFVPAVPAADDPVLARAPADAAPALDQQMVTQSLAGAFAGIGASLTPTTQVTVVARGACWLVRSGDRLSRVARRGDELLIFAAPLFEVISSTGKPGDPWVLLSGTAQITVGDGDGTVWPQPAASTQSDVAELAAVRDFDAAAAQGVTKLTLQAPLANLYDTAKCVICANVVHVSQGETVVDEVLGSGAPAQPGQSFRLHRSPLTFGCDAGLYSPRALQVEVNGRGGRALAYGADAGSPAGERWHEIETLAFAGPAERAYSVSIDGAERATLRFGDGIFGARLPAGADNVRATYRFGAGDSGNVAAGSLVALRKRPAGVRSANNPCPASGGADAETVESLRLRAPRAVRCCDRIVSLADYAAFAEAFPGVLRAEATIVETAPGIHVVWLTVAAEGPVPISSAPRLQAALVAAIEANRADAVPFQIADPLLLRFDVRLVLTLWPNADAAMVEERLRATLAAEFSLDGLRFGVEVTPARLAAAARSVPGVAAVEPVALQLRGGLRPPRRLQARLARADPVTGEIVPALWPVINSATGIALELGK